MPKYEEIATGDLQPGIEYTAVKPPISNEILKTQIPAGEYQEIVVDEDGNGKRVTRFKRPDGSFNDFPLDDTLVKFYKVIEGEQEAIAA